MIDAKLEELRRSLVDLTRNNRLLNHRSKGQRSLALHVASAAEMYKRLVAEHGLLQFLAREEAPSDVRGSLPNEADTKPPAELGEATQGDLPLAPAVSDNGKSLDLRGLQTLLSGDKLQTRLVDLAREAHSAIEEQGCNLLYCTFGLVEWCEAEQSSVVSRAPLIFVPVELKRKSVNTRYAMQMFDDETVLNSSLIELCQAQFQLSLPAFDADADDLDSYFAAIDQALTGMRGWKLTREVNIGLYSFTKLQMYRDLDPKNWPEGSKLTTHPLVNALTGTDEPSEREHGELPIPGELDEVLKPADCFQVVDADSSQQAAILAAKRGLNLVIDGPPGTGKSQTITNIIAECLADGKTILFVSEKSAALEVVKRRLSQVGLADFVLELHSRQASKKVVIDEINRVLEKQAATKKVMVETADDLERSRQSLNHYARELHEPFGAIAIAPFEAMARAIGLSAEPETTADIPDVQSWSTRQLSDALDQINKLDQNLARAGNPSKHPWRGTSLVNVGLKEKQQILRCCDRLTKLISSGIKLGGALAKLLGQPAPRTVKAISECLARSRRIGAIPASVEKTVREPYWDESDAEFRSWLSTGQEFQVLREQLRQTVKPDANRQDWQPVLDRRQKHLKNAFRFLRPSWFADSKLIRRVTLDGSLPAPDGQRDLLASLVKASRLRTDIERGAPTYGTRMHGGYQGVDSDWKTLTKFAEDAAAARAVISSKCVGADRLEKLLGAPERALLLNCSAETEAELAGIRDSWRRWLAAVGSSESQWLKADFETLDLIELSKRLVELPPHIDSLQDYSDLRLSFRRFANSPTKQFINWAVSAEGKLCHGRMAATFKRHFYRLLVDAAFSQRPNLRSFRGREHEGLIERFAHTDRYWLSSTRDRLASLLAGRRPSASQSAHRQSKLGMIQAEARKKIRHMPLRKLLKEAGEVVQAIKPCFMMSPLSVAQYLVPGGIQFDLVIFDEASQVEPADAYGAIARAKQVILVGDEKQLPPTNFFGRADTEGSPADDDTEFKSSDLESILSLGIVRFRHRCGLRWHYRSRHASLIEFSNLKFYQGQLRIFPSPHTDCSEYGLAFRYVENATYLRGAGRYNPVEAAAVAAEVIRHAIEHPETSLGVGTLNQPQQRAIEDEVERLQRSSKDPRVEAFFTRHQNGEHFFVKNLENIQGDEREVIFLSVGFGKDADGRFSLALGALNSEGGWRRLNVLVTRARRRCLVFSSIRHDDINLGSTQARGVVALKEYLYAAEHGRLREASVAGGDHDSEFEADVCRSLQNAGWEVHSQVGCAGFSIDLAVVDPRAPGRYLLGVECDGATYHSSPTARDRDRLRQEVLENLGWTIHRIWSTDWFQRPKPVLEVLLLRLASIRDTPLDKPITGPSKSHNQDEETTETAPDELPVTEDENSHAPTELPKGTVPYEHTRNAPAIGTAETLTHYPVAESARIVERIVRIEGPIHRDEALRVYAEFFSTRASARPREFFSNAVAYAENAKWLVRRDEFLWCPDKTEIQIRHRSGDCPVTDSEMIPPEEFEAAVMHVVRQQFGIKFDAVIEAVARLFGFGRTGAKLKNAVERALIRLDQRGQIQLDSSGFVTLLDGSFRQNGH